jgi:hypothetical protein
MNATLWFFLALPIIGAALVKLYARESLARSMGKYQSLIAIPLFALPGIVLVALVFGISQTSAVSDVEIWNGQVASKERVHGEYERSYDCRCRDECRGSGQNRTCSRVCDTCYEDRYTVHWYCNTTLGRFTIDSRDTTSRSVWNTPNPARYESIQPGDPVSKRSSYTNYVQAVPESLFRFTGAAASFASMLPPYPDQIYDLYRIDRFVQVGFKFDDAGTWNREIGMLLRELGPKKQVNLIVVVARTEDPRYAHALLEAWEGANKNDVVLVIGSADGQRISWVDVLSWSRSELFKVQLRDDVQRLGVIDRARVLQLASQHISSSFERRQMAEFEYLADAISPPEWLLMTLAVMLCVGYGGGAWWASRVAGARRR